MLNALTLSSKKFDKINILHSKFLKAVSETPYKFGSFLKRSYSDVASKVRRVHKSKGGMRMYYENDLIDECVAEENDVEARNGNIAMAVSYAQLSVAFGRSAACFSAPKAKCLRD